MQVDYSKTEVPKEYVCAECGATNCKLWREYQTFDPQLLCCDCAGKDQEKDVSTMDHRGMRDTDMGPTDQIGWYVPAVPDEEGLGYWGYTSVPVEGVAWWRSLPTRSKK